MDENISGFSTWVAERLGKIISHYEPIYEVERDVVFAGERLLLSARMHNRQPLAIMGFRTEKMGPLASEYIFVIEDNLFDMTCMSRAEAILLEARREYVKNDKEQIYTYLSVIVLVGALEAGMEKSLARRKRSKEAGGSAFGGLFGGGYGGGAWTDERVVVISRDGRFISNGDGKTLRDLMRGALNKKK